MKGRFLTVAVLFAGGLLGADPQTLIRQVAVYDYGKDPAAVRELEALVYRQGSSIEKLLLTGLDSAKTLAAKDAFCRNLAIVGTDASVPKLAAMLRDPNTAEMARYALAKIPGARATAALREALPKTAPRAIAEPGSQPARIDPERRQVQMLAALAAADKPGARPVLVESAANQSESVRVMALLGLAKWGTAADLRLLADLAANASGDEQGAARAALGSIRGDAFDAAVLQAIPGAEPKVKVELIRAVGARGIVSAQAVLLAAAGDTSRPVRVESIRALRETAGAKEVPALLGLLTAASSDSDRREIERTTAAAIRRSREANVSEVLAAYNRGPDVSLLNILSSAGNSAALPTIRQALQNPNENLQRAALNALSNWPTPEPLDDLLGLARSGSPAQRILALRGYIQLVQVPSSRTPAETARLLKTAFSAATRADEKRAVLSVAQRLMCPESLELARTAAQDPEVSAEAQLAVTTLERGLSFLRR